MQSIKSSLKPLIESSHGVHVTIYMVNEGGQENIMRQLRQSLEEAHDFLQPVMSLQERQMLLAPLDHLLVEGHVFHHMQGNIGLFRTKDSFRILSIPVDMPRSVHVATTFHVKPLLQWIQVDQEYFLLGLDGQQAHLYIGNYHSIQLIESIACPLQSGLADSASLAKKGDDEEILSGEIPVWIRSWIWQRASKTNPLFFIAGPPAYCRQIFKGIKYHRTVREPLLTSFSKPALESCTSAIQDYLESHAHRELASALVEYEVASEENRTRRNIFQIAKAAALGKVRKLIIAKDTVIHGKLDLRTGGLALHPFDLDHEDDDILDDLAQAVLARGGEVLVVDKAQLPKGRAALAILDESLHLEQSPSPYLGSALNSRGTPQL
ncbi:MAG: hypothetical protein ACK5P7_05325 [Bdellovibrio sp.]